ncbi:redoxin domain-containing protein [Oleiharenicola lentus]|uniref:redoxin domain-containing protein n=1 Tax=Oleiharenicola lentus TaxID=2508720 RepID=UPI003F678330
MKLLNKILLVGAASFAAFSLGHAAAVVGQAAPDFTLTDINGQKHSLSDFKGKTVVLEWVNQECPFVVKHYDKSGNMPKTQKAATDAGVVWLQVNSGSPGAQGDFDPAKVAAWQKKNNVASTAYFRDQDGKVGKLYDARTTPHMYVVDGSGTLVYAGGIDSINSGKTEDISKATNYVNAALADIKAGKPVSTPSSKPYGCSVKYAN